MSFDLDMDPPRIESYLRERGWIAPGESIERAEKAGEGNMNRTVRVHSDRRSFILKQSKPYCVKFPEIPAPIERLAVEVDFYRIARRSDVLAARMPEVLAFDPDAFVAQIEDLGSGSDLMGLYGEERLAADELATLCSLARELHRLPLTNQERDALGNHAMRELNHDHIFDIPLRPDNGIDLESITPGLTELADALQKDDDYVARVIALGHLYLHVAGPALLHGDYYPGSFLRTGRGLCIIDPEFAFPGPVEFDLGVLAAHLVFSGSEIDIVDRIGAAYAAPIDTALVKAFAGTEMMRRTLGVSQLPVHANLDRKREWLDLSREWLCEES